MEEQVYNFPRLNEPAPNFTAKTTHGELRLSDLKGQWVVLFSHPADFTPVCTTEFIAFAKKNEEFKEPSAYDILACLTKYDPGTFKDFCDEYGYSEDSIKALKSYEAVKNEYLNLLTLYNEKEMDLLREMN